MQNEIGTTAGLIWNALDAKGKLSLAKLKSPKRLDTALYMASGQNLSSVKIDVPWKM
jgi:hypothetical protein